ncbi:MAG: hypothetical protein MI861_12685, partial [Pirellulales bacterium]|nr:hypothetical protein [Pirellulales bacterium]
CLPGSFIEKACVFDHLMPLMNPGATLFGSTILREGVALSWQARRLMEFYNRKGIFTNQSDCLSDLDHALKQRLHNVTLTTVGCVAIFAGQTPTA